MKLRPAPAALLAGLAALLEVSAALSVGPISLPRNNTYISYYHGPAANNSLIRCVHELQQGEEVAQVSWGLWHGDEEEGTYSWDPTQGGTASGSLTGVVNLTRGDGHLELTALRYDLGGDYSCRVTLTSGESQAAAREEVIVFDTQTEGRESSSRGDSTTCTYTAGYKTPTTYPMLTVRAGMYSPSSGGFYDMVTSDQWHKEIYSNGSVSQSFSDVGFKIDSNTHRDAVFKVTEGLEKKDGAYISLFITTSESIVWTKRGCPPLQTEEHQAVRFLGKPTCRGEYTSFGTALVTCEEGYHTNGTVTSLRRECDEETYKWVPEPGSPPHADQLQCVVDGDDDGDGDGDGASSLCCSAALLGAALFFLSVSRP